MSLESALEARCQSKCELCNASESLLTHNVAPKLGHSIEEQIAICGTCLGQIEDHSTWEVNHWRCLNDSIWNPEPAVQVVAYRILEQLTNEEWAQDLKGMMYMDESTLEWANSLSDQAIVHKDCNGNILNPGDTVTLIKDLDVKGAGFIAKRGTAVRRINLVADNAEHIQGRINNQTIIILTKYVKK